MKVLFLSPLTFSMLIKRLLFLVLLTPFIGPSYSQDPRIDSLHELIGQSTNDSTLANLNLQLGEIYLRSELDSSVKYSERSLEFARKSAIKNQIIKALSLSGNYYERKAEYDEAMTRYQEALDLSRETEDIKGLAVVLNNIAIIHTDRGEFPKALEMYQEALDCEEKLGNKQGIAEAYNNIGIIYYYQQDMDRVFEYFEKSIEISEEIDDVDGMKRGYNNIGALYYYFENFEKAEDYYNRSYELAVRENDKLQMSQNLNNLSNTYHKKGELAKAIDFLNQSIDIKLEIEDYAGVANSYHNFGSLYHKEKEYNKAEEYYLKSIDFATEHKSRYILQEAYQNLASLYDETGRSDLAYDYVLLQSSVKDSILNIEKTKIIEETEAKFQTERKNRELAEKDKELAVSAQREAEAELKRKQTLYGLGGGSIGLLFLGLFVIQRNKRKSQAEKDAAVIEERDKGLKAVINAQEDERTRISKDLHDGIGQQLSGLKMAWQKLSSDIGSNNPDEFGRLMDLTKILDDSASEVRNISHQMMPKTLQELGLAPAIEDMLNKSLAHSDIEHSFETYNTDQRFKREIELGLYRVCQELVNNIIKHSGANMVSVQLLKNANNLVMIVEDNGRGIEPGSGDEGHGMLNMKSRMNTVNGEVNLEPSPGSGTVATVRVPLG